MSEQTRKVVKLTVRRGFKQDLPTLSEGEPGLTIDTKEVYVGSSSGNIELARQDEVDALSSQVDTIENQINTLYEEVEGKASEEEVGIINSRINALNTRLDQKMDKMDLTDIYTQLGQKAEKTTVTNLTNQVTDLNTQVGELADRIESIGDGDLSEITQQLNSLTTQVEGKADQSSVDSLSGTVSTIGTELDTLSSQIGSVSSQMAQKADKTEVEGITTLLNQKADKSELNTVSTQVDTLGIQINQKADKSEVDSISTEVDGLTTQVNSLSSQVEGKADQSEVSGLHTSVNELESEVSGLSSQVSSIDNRLNQKADQVKVDEINILIDDIEDKLALKAAVFEQGVEPELSSEGDLWIDTSENSLQGTVYANLESAINQLNTTKADKTHVDSLETQVSSTSLEVDNLSSQVSDLGVQLDQKADRSEISGVSNQISELTTRVDQKADKSEVEEVNSRLAEKSSIFRQPTEPIANIGDLWVDTSPSGLQSNVYESLRSEITNLNNTKADQDEVDSLNNQVNTLSTQLSVKADKSYVDAEMQKRGVDVTWFSHLKAGNDWAPSFNAAISQAKLTGGKVIVPAGEYTISQPILIDSVSLIGDETSVFSTSSKGSVIRATSKTFSAIKQNSLTAPSLTFEISNLIIKDANVGLELTYVVNSSFKNIYIDNCTDAMLIGKSNASGCLFNTFDNFYTRNCTRGVTMTGKDFVNNNLFLNSFFSGEEYAFSLDCVGGLGAVSNQFIACEFRSDAGRGLILNNSISTTLVNPYLENKANAIRFKTRVTSTVIINPVLALLSNTNSYGDTAFFHLESNASITLIGGVTYLNQSSETDGLYQFSSDDPSNMNRVRILNNLRHIGSKSVPFHSSSNLSHGTVVRASDGYDWHITVNPSNGSLTATKLT